MEKSSLHSDFLYSIARKMSDSPRKAVSLARFDTEYSADSVEFCPFAGYEQFFVCGTYQVLEPKIQNAGAIRDQEVEEGDRSASEDGGKKQTQRTGRLYLFRVEEDCLVEVCRLDTAAILDLKWCPALQSGRPVVAAADATGAITLYTLSSSPHSLEQLSVVQVTESDILCLSIDWAPLDMPNAGSLIASLSSGELALVSPRDGMWDVETWPAHEYEPWITAFDKHDPHVVWSGGDDLKLKRWDLRDVSQPTLVNKRFDGGVTTIAFSLHIPHLMAVGSYDSHLRIFDSRNALRPISTIDIGGGIWRTKFHPSPQRKGDILLACMHGGFKIVRLPDSYLDSFTRGEGIKEEPEIITTFDEHESLAYGADWSRAPSTDGGSLVGTCSFYDHTLHLWRG